MQHKDLIILKKVISEIDITMDMMSDVSDFEAFDNDEKTKRAVCMSAINIGELVKGLSSELRSSTNHIAWKLVTGFRDIAAHKYQTLRMKDVYKTVIEDFPELKESILKILSE